MIIRVEKNNLYWFFNPGSKVSRNYNFDDRRFFTHFPELFWIPWGALGFDDQTILSWLRALEITVRIDKEFLNE